MKQFLLQDHTILLEKFRSSSQRSVIFRISINISIFAILILTINSSLARSEFDFEFGDKVNVLSDKAYKIGEQGVFEAVGNVIITNKNKSLYGEKATIYLDTGEVEIVGNVRYIAPGLSIYGSKLSHNFKKETLFIKNARIVSNDYVVFGKKLAKISETELYGENAEYTTCKDCPESWSISGKKIYITLGEYVRIHHVFVKMKGVVVMYLPYLIIPIKKDRETGLLFFKFGKEGDNGLQFAQPWFWNINSYSDLTFTPIVWEEKGVGSSLQYRHLFGRKKWLEVNSFQLFDRTYEENLYGDDLESDTYFRNFLEYEHHYNSYHFNHHILFSGVKEMDIIRDFYKYTEDMIYGSEVGAAGFINYRNTFLDINVESYYNKNLLVPQSNYFDKSYVQILPKVTIFISPLVFKNSFPVLNKFLIGLDMDITNFKQMGRDDSSDDNYIRNAMRYNVVPYIDFTVAEWGPVTLDSNIKLDLQRYYFPYQEDKNLLKRGYLFETELSFDVEKIFGISYKESIPISEIKKIRVADQTENNESSNNRSDDIDVEKEGSGYSKGLIGSFPSFKDEYINNNINIVRNSYRHLQQFKLKHYYLAAQRIDGNTKFQEQINEDEGQFDYRDVLRGNEHILSNVEFKKVLPKNNTLEFVWNNYIIMKTPTYNDVFIDGKYLRDNFKYRRISYFTFSQGYDFNINNKEVDDPLTRLHVTSGFSLKNYSINFAEYYFHKPKKSIFYIGASNSFSLGRFGVSFSYDAISVPIKKLIILSGTITPFDTMSILGSYTYDFIDRIGTENSMELLYSPHNNCWKFNFKRVQTMIDTKYSFNFLINFGSNSFTSFN